MGPKWSPELPNKMRGPWGRGPEGKEKKPGVAKHREEGKTTGAKGIQDKKQGLASQNKGETGLQGVLTK